MMKFILLALFVFTTSLHAYDDDSRRKEVEESNKSEGYPTTLANGVYIHGYVYNADLDAMVLVLVGNYFKDKSATAKQMRDYWNGQVGQALRKIGFRDFAVLLTTEIDGGGVIFSPRFNKWMNADDYLKLK
jgi:hypothetical protein